MHRIFVFFLTGNGSCIVSVTVLQICNPLIFFRTQSVLCRGKLELKFISLFVDDLQMLDRGVLRRVTIRKVLYRGKEGFHILSAVMKFSYGYRHKLV